jgi:hypothetical protein
MATTHFSGPVASANGFEGDVTGAITGNVTGDVTGSITLPTFTVTTANALATKPAGKLIFVSNGLAGDPCVAVGNGTNWISPAGTPIAIS